MVEQIEVTGMVISAMPIGEYNKRLVLVTKEKGKINVFVNGARKQNSRFAAGSQPFSFGKFHIYPGKDAYNLGNMEITEYFDDVSKDIESMYYGFYFLELAGALTVENNDGVKVLRLLYSTLRAVVKSQNTRGQDNNISLRLIRRIFELRMLEINGSYPNIFRCCKCGTSDNLVALDFFQGSVTCKACLQDTMTATYEPGTIFTMQHIIARPVEKLYSFKVSDKVLTELESIMDRLMGTYVHKEMKSLEALSFLRL